jgi:predicted ester cyclase
MNSIDIGAIMREMHAAWNAKDMDKCASYARPDARMTMPSGDSIPFREYIEMWARAFPDGQITEVNTVVQGNTVVSEFIGKGTHTGSLGGPMGPIPATNRRLEMKLVEIGEFTNGKLTAARVYFDTAGMMMQLGLMPQIGAQGQRQAATPRA